MEAILAGHSQSYHVIAAVVMPNHVHAVLRIERGVALADVVRGIKGASAHGVNRLLGREGRLWQPDYFDRVVRSAGHLERCVGYVHWNPVKAGLCDDLRHYVCSTANPFYEDRIAVCDGEGSD